MPLPSVRGCGRMMGAMLATPDTLQDTGCMRVPCAAALSACMSGTMFVEQRHYTFALGKSDEFNW
jgi:hypothetical protein